MNRLAYALVSALAATSALADPLGDAIHAADGIVCFTRSYDSAWLAAHPSQTLREAKFMISYRDSDLWQGLRMSLKGERETLYLFGDCHWGDSDSVNRSAQDNILIPSFKAENGIGCMLMTDVTGASAEEGGYFVVDWQDGGQKIEVHLDDYASAWRTLEAGRSPDFVEFNPADRVIRLHRAEPSECADLARFAESQPE